MFTLYGPAGDHKTPHGVYSVPAAGVAHVWSQAEVEALAALGFAPTPPEPSSNPGPVSPHPPLPFDPPPPPKDGEAAPADDPTPSSDPIGPVSPHPVGPTDPKPRKARA